MPQQEIPLSDFIESVDDMIARDFASDAMRELKRSACDVKNSAKAEEILQLLIRSSIAHARSQFVGRNNGDMSFDQAMELARIERVAVTRPGWDIFLAVRIEEKYITAEQHEEWCHYFRFDNCDGIPSGSGWPYRPSDDDRAATDWMLYQTPQDNWVDLKFD